MKKQIRTNRELIDVDISCDICGNSCLIETLIVDNESNKDHGEKLYIFEYMDLKTNWGYYSDTKDMETWTAQVCEKCTDIYLEPLIIFNKTCQMTNKELNKEIQEKRRIVINRDNNIDKLL
jgi:hypothetical protein